MAKFVAVKLPALIGGGTQRGLFPAPEFAEALVKIGDGEFVTIDVKKARNLKRLRFYWALMRVVFDNVDNTVYPSLDDFSDGIKVCVGLRDRFWIPPGTVLDDGLVVGALGMWGYRAGHINFEAMEEVDFIGFINRVVDLICKWYLPTIPQGQLLKKVQEMCGIRPWWHEGGR